MDRNQREEVHRLLGKGASIHTKRSDGYSVLMLAARNGDLNLMRAAMGRGLSVNSHGGEGWTPLIEAMNGGTKSASAPSSPREPM